MTEQQQQYLVNCPQCPGGKSVKFVNPRPNQEVIEILNFKPDKIHNPRWTVINLMCMEGHQFYVWCYYKENY